MAGQDRQGTRGHPAPLACPDRGQQRRPGAIADAGARQAAGRGPRRTELRVVVRGMVCRGSQARLRRRAAAHPQRPAHAGHPPAGRRVRGHHRVEFPVGARHAQGQPRAGRRLHRRAQAL
ncbi:hypothetical protein G6F40_015240 [Rhizopus arrhizus]|uniref:Uncharacterized protein n=1 Tax=Rhizopus delemar TaxID=936053 RepID=A0A9P6XU89_9FUNG|nr:hypothetical protein G6F40_015240 [Rhizopus arrhizus]KAG1532262.1 hypothetical protein G6F50_016283 [Rhizopus delemar]